MEKGTQSADDRINFGVSKGFHTRFKELDEEELALEAKDDSEAREELYRRLEPAMNRALKSYSRRYPKLEEGECVYALYLATERAIKKYTPGKTTFVRYWSTCASRALLKCSVRYSLKPTEVEYQDTCIYFQDKSIPTDQLDSFFDQARATREDPLPIICLILRMADYSNEEIGEMMEISQDKARSEQRAALRRFRSFVARSAGH